VQHVNKSNDLLCVEWDVKPYTLTQVITANVIFVAFYRPIEVCHISANVKGCNPNLLSSKLLSTLRTSSTSFIYNI